MIGIVEVWTGNRSLLVRLWMATHIYYLYCPTRNPVKGTFQEWLYPEEWTE